MTAITTITTIARTATTAIQAAQKVSKLQKVAKIAVSKPALAAEGAAIGVGLTKLGGLIAKKIKSSKKNNTNDDESDIIEDIMDVDTVEEGTIETEQIIDVEDPEAQPTETDCEKCNADREIGETIKEKDEKKNTSKKK